MSSKASLIKRVKASSNIVLPLIFDSLERIETISQAMELRRFGKNKERTWYRAKPFKKADFFVIIGVVLIVGLGIGLFFVNEGRFFNPFYPR